MYRHAKTQLVLLMGLCLFLSARPAYGYIDPGAGSLVLQTILGGLLGCMLAVKIFWRQIKGWATRAPKTDGECDDSGDTGSSDGDGAC